MASSFDTAALIEALKRLYSRIASLDLQKRMRAYRSANGSAADHDIATPLTDYIEQLAAAEDGNTEQGKPAAAPQGHSPATPGVSRDHPQTRRQHPKVSQRFKDLSGFFRRRGTGPSTQPYLAQKLQASVWEHINTALRLARRGGAEGAKLHADLANNALKEAARFMSEEDYSEFYAQVKKRLDEARAEVDSI